MRILSTSLLIFFCSAQGAFARNTSVSSVVQSRIFLKQFAQCVVKRNPALATQYVYNYAQIDSGEKYKKLFDGYCLPTQLANSTATISGIAMVGAISDIFIQTSYSQAIIDFSTVPPLNEWVQDPRPLMETVYGKKRLDDKLAQYKQYSALAEFGECVVRSDPEKSFNFLRTDIGTAEENKMAHTLQNALDGCLNEGAVALDIGSLRNAMAYNYFRLSRAFDKVTR